MFRVTIIPLWCRSLFLTTGTLADSTFKKEKTKKLKSYISVNVNCVNKLLFLVFPIYPEKISCFVLYISRFLWACWSYLEGNITVRNARFYQLNTTILHFNLSFLVLVLCRFNDKFRNFRIQVISILCWNKISIVQIIYSSFPECSTVKSSMRVSEMWTMVQ